MKKFRKNKLKIKKKKIILYPKKKSVLCFRFFTFYLWSFLKSGFSCFRLKPFNEKLFASSVWIVSPLIQSSLNNPKKRDKNHPPPKGVYFCPLYIIVKFSFYYYFSFHIFFLNLNLLYFLSDMWIFLQKHQDFKTDYVCFNYIY